ncbi:MAG: xanthine dehydrogenase small subunit [Polaromonas sp.]|uniref:xanthine dehydrogenase small subunit n=1 Tax=Polaromonas sp. TaxID=1869339 RepID=UPI0017A843FD|nr:xanthine dehydrogenase small subunit [Polaromonas sp.]MBA3595256.1 xanthine dehydrogenase small subunit [Polaromonas sp.]
MSSPLNIIRFVRGGQLVSLVNVPPSRTLLEVLREDLGLTGTKEGCGEGDCGACTVVVGEAVDGKIQYKAVNSCIKLAHSIDGQALWTVEDIAPTLVASRTSLPPEGALRLRPGEAGSAAPAGNRERFEPTLHPAQQAMVDCHGSQCGFCTPGFVMSMFGMYQNHVCQGRTITRELAQQELSGNLCRCTGYRPIFDAAQQMAALPAGRIDEANLLSKMELLAPVGRGPEPDLPYKSPRTLAELLAVRAAHPGAQLVAGCTDVGLWVTKMHKEFSQVLDVTRVEELRRIERYPHHIAIGAAVTLSDAFAALVADRPQLQTFANRFAGLPVRNAGTLGGNVANGSPIGDSMPLLIALGANVVLMSTRGHREMPLELLYTGYRKNVMAPDEVLAWIKVPLPEAEEVLKAYKISKRYDDDISAVCLVVNLQLAGGKVAKVSIGAGGVAAVPARAVQTEAFLRGKVWTQATVLEAMQTLRDEFQPLSDMRASATYRSEVLGNLLQRFWLESQGMQQINLESFLLEEAQA